MLKGKVAVVTGGTRGIGYAIVKKYLENGAKVVLFGSRDETVNKALAALKEENPDWEVSGYAPNLLDPKALEETIAKIKEQYGRIDILVNNAGISDSTKIDDYTAEQFAKVMDLNVKAIFNAIMPTVKIMKEQGGGCIINTSSMVSISGQPSGVAYPTSKTAVNGLTWSLARSLARYKNALATSSGSPTLLSGIILISGAITCSGKAATISVFVIPGATAFTRILLGPSSLARDHVKPLIV